MARSWRNMVEKPKPTFQPMRFKSQLHEGFVVKKKKIATIALENYLQVIFVNIICYLYSSLICCILRISTAMKKKMTNLCNHNTV